jgi:hypothetical protein
MLLEKLMSRYLLVEKRVETYHLKSLSCRFYLQVFGSGISNKGSTLS